MKKREQHFGLSYLRQCTKARLRELNDAKQIVVLHGRFTPVAVLVSYKRYMEIQRLIRDELVLEMKEVCAVAE